jgi:uncharacterized membrane protein
MNKNYRSINATQSISEGFRLAGINWGLNIGFLIVVGIIGFVIGLLPVVSQLYSSFIAPIIIFGYGIVAHKFAKNERVEFGDYFKGFDQFVPLLLTNLAKTLVTILFALPFLFYIIDAMGGLSGIMNLINSISNPSESREVIEQIIENFSVLSIPIAILLGLLIAIPGFLLMFSLFFVWYKKSEPIDALKQSMNLVMENIGQIILFAILLAVINIVATIPCGIGLLFTIPASAYATYSLFASAVEIDDSSNKTTMDHFIGQ